MSDRDFTIGQGDTGVPWAVTVYDANGNPIDLTGATSVILHYRIEDWSSAAVEVAGTVVGVAPMTHAQRIFQGSDTATPGVYDAEWLITLLSGERITYPACAGRPKMKFEVFVKP